MSKKTEEVGKSMIKAGCGMVLIGFLLLILGGCAILFLVGLAAA